MSIVTHSVLSQQKNCDGTAISVPHFRYRADIDGMRAIAVMAVVFYHAGIGCTGGYIGVDVFFVISGYLITSLILKDLENGSFSFFGFYERRARRIIPALSAVILFTLITGWFILEPRAYKDLGRSAMYQGLFAANFYFWATSGYFDGSGEEKPLLHTWSLAVEEQFYLIVPLVIFVTLSRRHLRNRGGLISLILTALIISFMGSIYGVIRFPRSTFYLLPARAWELLAGALLAALPTRCLPRSLRVREAASYVGFAGILIPCFNYVSSTAFPGLAAVPPCIGAALLIWSNTQSDNNYELSSLNRKLAHPWLVFIGAISYSLYLWHWPLFAFSKCLSPGPVPVQVRCALVGISFLAAIVSWRWVETPFRLKSVCHRRSSIFAFASASVAAGVVLGALISHWNGIPGRFSKEFTICFDFEHPAADPDFWRGMTSKEVDDDRMMTFGQPNSEQPTRFLVWGDSHAMTELIAIHRLFNEKGQGGIAAVTCGVPPIGLPDQLRSDSLPATTHFGEAVIRYIERHAIPNVILISRWRYYGSESGTWNHAATFRADLLRTVRRLKESGCQPWIVQQIPELRCDARKALFLVHALGRGQESDFSNRPDDSNGIDGNDASFLSELEVNGARVIDPRPEFLDGANDRYRMSINGRSIYSDANHVNSYGAMTILYPWFSKQLTSILNN